MMRTLLGLGLLSAVLATACQPPPLIDRTRPDYFRKTDLTQGTWYIMDTVVGVPATSGLAFEGMQGELFKVRFEVQESHLVAFRVHEYIPGSDPRVDPEGSAPGGTVSNDGAPYRGAPVYAWPIVSHFDRQRQYNAATGEQSNILEENTTDRPWFDREFIRVDWGTNPIRNHFTLSGSSDPTDGFSPYVSPLELAEGDDALTAEYVEKEGGASELVYLDFTVRQHWAPETVDYPGYGKIPYCLFDPTEDCNSAEIRVRTSMKRVDEARVADYEPLVYDDRMMVKFGFFRTERLTYDRNRGLPESGRILLANRHNLWERAHDDGGNVIPVTQRQVRPVAYHLTSNFPRELLPAARDLEASWDHALRRAVAVPRGLEPEQVPQVLFVCETPVPVGAPAACGPAGTAPRMGDIRYNLLAWVDRPQKGGPLGYGPAGTDPETGEIVQAGAYIYGAAMDAWSGESQLLLDVLNGTTSIEELIAGTPVRDYVRSSFSPGDVRQQSGPAVSRQGLTSTSGTSLAPYARAAGRLRSQLDAWTRSGTPPVELEDRRRVVDTLIAQNPALESTLIELPEVRAAVMSLAPGASWRHKLETDEVFYRTVARQTMLRMDDIRALQQRRADWASRHNIWLAEFSDDAFAALARSKKQRFDELLARYLAEGKGNAEARRLAQSDVYLELRQAAFRSLAGHEVGHTLGLRHNFQGSFDALNYKDGYWQLRKESIGVQAGGKLVLPIEPDDLVAAAVPTQAQVEGGMAELAYSSIMDYGARMNGSIHGLGRYDEAAILFAYAGGGELGWVEVFPDVRREVATPNARWETTRLDRPLLVRGAQVQVPFSQATHYTPYSAFYTDRFHYTTLPLHFADATLPLPQAIEQGVQRMGKRSYRKWSEMKPYYDAIQQELKSLGVDDVSWGYGDIQLPQLVLSRVAPTGMPVEVPYMFCSDGEVAANVTCNRWDAGADLYEMNRDWVSRYEDYYAFSHFKRDRLFFSTDSVFSRTYGRLLGNLPNVYQNWLFNQFIYQQAYGFTEEEMEELVGVGDPLWQSYFTMAVFDGLNTLLSTFSAVPPGYYGKVVDVSGTRW
ncbi:MAG: zinc-dependent metalloprotease, partial [Myxococcaceae bacterium]|nr:zinc-dependent metalloprotease [Myxococcaceae bacterium]